MKDEAAIRIALAALFSTLSEEQQSNARRYLYVVTLEQERATQERALEILQGVE